MVSGVAVAAVVIAALAVLAVIPISLILAPVVDLWHKSNPDNSTVFTTGHAVVFKDLVVDGNITTFKCDIKGRNGTASRTDTLLLAQKGFPSAVTLDMPVITRVVDGSFQHLIFGSPATGLGFDAPADANDPCGGQATAVGFADLAATFNARVLAGIDALIKAGGRVDVIASTFFTVAANGISLAAANLATTISGVGIALNANGAAVAPGAGVLDLRGLGIALTSGFDVAATARDVVATAARNIVLTAATQVNVVTPSFVGTSVYVPSDQRIKQNIADANVTAAVQTLMAIRVRQYQYRPGFERPLNVTIPVGVIAQELQAVMPVAVKAVALNYPPSDGMPEQDFADLLTVENDRLISLLIATVQDTRTKLKAANVAGF
jgi:hypothetical protein